MTSDALQVDDLDHCTFLQRVILAGGNQGLLRHLPPRATLRVLDTVFVAQVETCSGTTFVALCSCDVLPHATAVCGLSVPTELVHLLVGNRSVEYRTGHERNADKGEE